MTSIFSGQLYRNLVKDQNSLRLESYDVNRFQKTVAQQTNQSQREKNLREGLEFHQAIMADLQTKLNEVTEKLNNLYRRFMDNKVAFRKVSSETQYFGTSKVLDLLPDVDSLPDTTGYPAGDPAAGILPYDDYDKIRNYGYNPFFGSKAIDASDKTLNRTFYQEPGVTAETAYRENGAFWSTISYLWGWDVDRINATYTTTDPSSGRDDVQINVTALQPNKPKYPPLKVGDRFPINWTGDGTAQQGYPFVNMDGIRPGGVDYSHATDSINTGGDAVTTPVNVAYATGNGNGSNPFYVDDISYFTAGEFINVDKGKPTRLITDVIPDPMNPPKGWVETLGETPYGTVNTAGVITVASTVGNASAHVNPIGHNALNMGWEFDDLPVSLEVQSVTQLPDGTTIPESYRVVYDIPPTHPFYDELRVLNGTEPQIIDAPTELVKERVTNPGFAYTGTIFVSETYNANYHKYLATYDPLASGAGCHNPGGCEVTAQHDVPEIFDHTLIGTFDVTSCSPAIIDPGNTRVSMQYRFRTHQNKGDWGATSPSDDGLGGTTIPTESFTTHDWNSAGAESTANPAVAWAIGDPPYWQVGLPGTWSQIVNEDISTSMFLVGTAPTPNAVGKDPYVNPGRGYPANYYEQVHIRAIQGASANEIKFEVYFTGDINDVEFEVKDIEIVTYAGDNRESWNASTALIDTGGGKYNPDEVEPIVMVGDPAYLETSAPVDQEVVNKYYPSTFQFTQFNDQYNNTWTDTDRNDILRSPWEFGMLNIGENPVTNETSKLSGEMSIDLNGRRLNIDYDNLNNEIDWDRTSGAVSGTGFDFVDTTLGVQNAYDFIAYTPPTDDCGDGSHAAEFIDSDPLTNDRFNLLDDETLSGEAAFNPTSTTLGSALGDVMRTDDPAWTQAGYYDNFYSTNPNSTAANPTQFKPNAENDYSGTIDRIAASSNEIEYTISIPTNDVNVLRKENNLLFNLGKIDGRDYGMQIENPFMEFRTATSYQTVPRYRVDGGGNIFDQFGDGYHRPAAGVNTNDQGSLDDLYTLSGGAVTNGQVSNDNGAYGVYDTTYDAAAADFEGYIQEHDRLSMAGDDYNLFDYVPDLQLVDPTNPEGKRAGESFVGAFPSNFYYYREGLDDSQGELGAPATGGTYNNDNKPALNFDGHNSNLSGVYNSQHTTVHNTEYPAFTSVIVGHAEQNAKIFNPTKTTTSLVWQGFPGLGGESTYGQSVISSSSVTDPLNALGNSNVAATMNFPTSSIIIDMGRPINEAGTLFINELVNGQIEPHAIPLPLIELASPFPSFDTGAPQSYTFNAYGAETVTRTGSKYMNFDDVFDGIDSQLDGTYDLAASKALLQSRGAVFASDLGDPLSPADWPNGLLLHVDDADVFDLTYPRNKLTLGIDTTEYRVVYQNSSTSPETIFIIPDDGSNITNPVPGTNISDFVHADLQVRALTGQYTISVVDDTSPTTPGLSANGTRLQIDYDAMGTDQVNFLASVELSSESDRVGRIAGDDPRTTATETDYIGPEVFDSPRGYVEPDAQVAINLISQDTDGNPRPRKLVSVRVEVASGEQIIPDTLSQTYSTTGPFDYIPGVADWPIALFEDNIQLNPQVTADIGYFVGLYQGITAFDATNPATPTITVTDTFGFGVGQKVTINGELRQITDITGNVITLDAPLSNNPKYGDRVSVGNGSGTQDIKMFLNRSFAMSMGAGMQVVLEYEEYDVQGYPPQVVTTSGTPVFERIGYTDPEPHEVMNISPANAGTLTLTVDDTTGFAMNDVVNVNGVTRTIASVTATTVTFTQSIQHSGGQPINFGSISHVDYENFLNIGDGRSGGAYDNEFTQELKRIIDNPEYQEVFRHDLFKNTFITASVSDPFNDLISSKLMLTWDRNRKYVEIQQVSYMAYFKSI